MAPGLVVGHDEDAEEVHQGREDRDQHDGGVGLAGELGHDEAARAHDGRHEHAADGSRRLDAAGHVRLEAGFLHHGDGEAAGGYGVGDGAAGDGPEQAACDHRHLGRSPDSVPHRRQRKVDEKALGSAGLQKGSEDDEQDHVGGQHVGHDAEHAVALVEDAGAEFGEGVAGMRDDLGRVLTVDTVDQHDGGQDDEGVPHHPPGQLDPQQHPRHGDPLIQVGFGADPIVDGLEVPHPVADADDGPGKSEDSRLDLPKPDFDR